MTETGPCESEPSSAEGCSVEITPEMIEAGLPMLYRYNAETCIAEEVVVEIFKEMLLKSHLLRPDKAGVFHL